LSLIATVPTSAVAYLARSSTPIIARFDVGAVLLNTELIPENALRRGRSMLLFKANNYIEIILRDV